MSAVVTETLSEKLVLSDVEKAKRKAEVDFARGSVRLEGFLLDEGAEYLNQRYVNGSLSSSELTSALLEHARSKVNR
jgi:hypothetical protein